MIRTEYSWVRDRERVRERSSRVVTRGRVERAVSNGTRAVIIAGLLHATLVAPVCRAYRWSQHAHVNTAVLRLNKGSALGKFLFRTALKNGLDFHPMSISKYTKDAYIEGLLLRLPDALFDSAWLNTESYQRDRPPQPYFTECVTPIKLWTCLLIYP